MARVIHFEIAADNPEKIVDFYKSAFEWKIEKWNGPVEYWLVTTGDPGEPGINGGIGRRIESWDKTLNIIDVNSVDENINKIENLGGKVLRSKFAVPSVGYLAYCLDPEGNPFGIMEDDPAAK
jgi:predicted enzyme related to lactoylglutathione lyase